MTTRCLVLLMALYVAMDFSNPWMPGAFAFDSSASVDSLSARRDGASAPLVGAPASDLTLKRRLQRVGLTSLPSTSPARPRSQWGVGLRRAHAPSPDLAPPGEEH